MFPHCQVGIIRWVIHIKLYQEEPNLLILFVRQEIELFVLVVISDVFDIINMEHFI